ncbi:MAG: CPBP family intramembrane glutamic endopeptidase [Gaiellaceae bacterium]
MGSVGLGRVTDRPQRLAGWVALVGTLAALNYASRFTTGKPPKNVLFHWDNAIGSVVEFGFILVIVLFIARGNGALLALRRPRSIRGAAGSALAVLVGIYILSAILSPVLHPGREQGLAPDRWQPAHLAPFVANTIVVCVVAPFVEELTFRGVGYGLMATRFGVEPAIVATALFFGLAHGLVQALPLLVAFGIGLAWLRDRQGSVIPGMILHGTFNGIALLISLTT